MLMQPSPPLPLAQRMTPTQRILSIFFQPFFSDTFSNAFFMIFGSHLGAQNRQKSHPGPKKCVRRRRRMRFSLVFGAVAVRSRCPDRFSLDFSPKFAPESKELFHASTCFF